MATKCSPTQEALFSNNELGTADLRVNPFPPSSHFKVRKGRWEAQSRALHSLLAVQQYWGPTEARSFSGQVPSISALRGPRQPSFATLRIFLQKTSGLTRTRGRLVGSYGTTWSFPLLHNGSLRSCRVGQRKVKETPCNSLFKHDLIRPTLTPRKHVLTCANRTDLVSHDPHRSDDLAHLIRVRSLEMSLRRKSSRVGTHRPA
jgi:hypothetical protein